MRWGQQERLAGAARQVADLAMLVVRTFGLALSGAVLARRVALRLGFARQVAAQLAGVNRLAVALVLVRDGARFVPPVGRRGV